MIRNARSECERLANDTNCMAMMTQWGLDSRRGKRWRERAERMCAHFDRTLQDARGGTMIDDGVINCMLRTSYMLKTNESANALPGLMAGERYHYYSGTADGHLVLVRMQDA